MSPLPPRGMTTVHLVSGNHPMLTSHNPSQARIHKQTLGLFQGKAPYLSPILRQFCCWNMVGTQCYLSSRCTMQWFDQSIHHAVHTMSIATICHRTTLSQHRWLCFLGCISYLCDLVIPSLEACAPLFPVFTLTVVYFWYKTLALFFLSFFKLCHCRRLGVLCP